MTQGPGHERAAPRTRHPRRLLALHQRGLRSLRDGKPPSNKQEEYRFTDPARIIPARLVGPARATVDAARVVPAFPLSHPSAVTVVMVDGGVQGVSWGPYGPPPAGVYVGAARDAPEDALDFSLGTQQAARGSAFAALNAATCTDTLVIRLPPGARLRGPVHVVHLAAPGMGDPEQGGTCLGRRQLSLGFLAAVPESGHFLEGLGLGLGLWLAFGGGGGRRRCLFAERCEELRHGGR